MIKLSEIIKTDCYIDCGSNDKLREVVKVLHNKHRFKCLSWDNSETNHFISIYPETLDYIITRLKGFSTYPTHHISEIDLNN